MIRLWLSKDARTPVREQLSAQLLLGVISGNLAAGEKLPSVRDLARRLRIHRNTVSAVYQDLARRGWLEVRQGSGVYVMSGRDGLATGGVDAFVRAWMEQAHLQGYSASDLQAALARLASPGPQLRWLVVDADGEFARILAEEIAEGLAHPVEWAALDSIGPGPLPDCLVLVNEGHAKSVSHALGETAVHAVAMKTVAEIVAGIQRPATPVLIALVSRSRFILQWAATLLSALGFGPECVLLRNPLEPGWANGLGACDIVAADVVAAKDLSVERRRTIVFRIVASSAFAQIRKVVTA